MKLYLAIASVVVVASCGKGDEPSPGKSKLDIANEYRTRVKARMEKLAAAVKVGEAAKGELGAPGEAKLVLDNSDSPSANTLVGFPRQVDGTAGRSAEDTEPGFEARNPFVPGTEALAMTSPGSANFDEAELKALVGAKYVLIVYPDRWVAPKLTGGSFEPGVFDGTAVAVEIDTGKSLGGFPVHAESSEKIETSRNTKSGYSDAESQIRKNIRTNLGAAVAKGADARWPGSKISFSYR